MTLNLEPSATGIVLCGDSNPVFLSFANALFNPREYTIDRVATITTSDPAGRATHSMTVSPPESFSSIIGAGQVAGITGGAIAGRTFSANQVHHNAMSRIVVDELVPFFASTDSYMLRLPPAVSTGVAEPVGHILCVVKTKTKSNQSNDRIETLTDPTFADEIAAQNVRILLQGGDGKGQASITPISMGAMKLTKADAGRTLDSVGKEMKIQKWIKDSYDRRIAPFDPSLTNVLQFDISSTEAEKLATQFQLGQSMRIKVKFPWLCDTDCDMTEPLTGSWIEKISVSTSRISIVLKPEACRLLPTVNK